MIHILFVVKKVPTIIRIALISLQII